MLFLYCIYWVFNSAVGFGRFELEKKSKLLEQIYVHDVYERIAEDFESQQYRPWPKIKEFLDGLEPGSLVLDVGKSTKEIVIARAISVKRRGWFNCLLFTHYVKFIFDYVLFHTVPNEV